MNLSIFQSSSHPNAFLFHHLDQSAPHPYSPPGAFISPFLSLQPPLQLLYAILQLGYQALFVGLLGAL